MDAYHIFGLMQVKYAPQLPFVLKGLTVTFPGGMKTGIVGRTGSGKSTLIQALFRIVDPTIGQIVIDGVDICAIGLHDLRSRLSITLLRELLEVTLILLGSTLIIKSGR